MNNNGLRCTGLRQAARKTKMAADKLKMICLM